MALSETGSNAVATASREISSTRVFDAPRDLVFRMWTDREHIAQWYGPRGFSLTTEKMDVQPGGEWIFVMHGPDGTDYKNHIIFDEIDAPNRLVYTHLPGPRFTAIITFEDAGEGKTRLTMRSILESAEIRKAIAHYAVPGMHQTLDRLEEKLAAQVAREFAVSRTFDAPRALVFEAWTEEKHLTQWWGPKGATIIACTNDLRPEGVLHYGMRMPDGMEMWGRWVYREVTPPRRLVFVSTFSDPEGGITRAPFPAFEGKWPLETLSTITFEEEDGRTTVTVRWVPFHATEAERKMFDDHHASMRGGWTGTFEQLGTYLERIARA